MGMYKSHSRAQSFVSGYNDDFSDYAFSLILGQLFTKDECIENCKNIGYGFAGLRSHVCHCSNSYDKHGENLSSGGCSNLCSTYGIDQYGRCGGDEPTISVYTTGITGTEPDWTGIRHLELACAPTLLTHNPPYIFSQAGCIIYCRIQGYVVAGVRQGHQCFCGSQYGSDSPCLGRTACTVDSNSFEFCSPGCGGTGTYTDVYSTGCPGYGALTCGCPDSFGQISVYEPFCTSFQCCEPAGTCS